MSKLNEEKRNMERRAPAGEAAVATSCSASDGPWYAVNGHEGEEKRWGIYREKGPHYTIAVVENGAPGDTLETEEATANLIAAAPDLLKSLKEIVAIADRKTDAFDQAKRAIAKALNL